MKSSKRTSPSLRPSVLSWIRGSSGTAGEPEESPDWDAFVLRKLAAGRAVWLGKVLVDRDVVEQRFSCVSERCAPGPNRGKWRSCCADVEVELSPGEERRLRRHSGALDAYVRSREPRVEAGNELPFWRTSAHAALARPCGRCVFSKLDAMGRIRCHLRRFAELQGLEQSDVQPLSCRLFPLILVDLGAGRTLLTIVSRLTAKMTGHHAASRYPCLNDAALPPLYRSMGRDLDWLFGVGFARQLALLERRGTSIRPTR